MTAEEREGIVAGALNERTERRIVEGGLSTAHAAKLYSRPQWYPLEHQLFSSRCSARVHTPTRHLQGASVPLYADFLTSLGNFTIRLFDEQTPKTVENFVGLAEGTKEWTDPRSNQKVTQPYYDGVIFHRVISGFMIQGGDPLGQGIGGPGFTFGDEFHPSLRHDKPGMLSMANRGPNTNGGQFFITLAPTPHLDDRHTVFGEVVDGMDVVRQIGSTKTGERDRPLTDVVIQTVKIRRE
jgi:peptidyl-prolyl cis-trans isomerase A (cyclophilin A)